MKTSFRIISLIVSVCIVISALPLIFITTATESEPTLPNRCDMVISKEGVNGDFGAKYNSLANNTKITLSSTTNLSTYEDFEFDIYVEDASALKAAIESSPDNDEQGLDIFFGSSTISPLWASKNTAYADFSEQITENGWNHISISKSDFTDNSIDWAKVKYIFLRFNDNITDSHTDLANTSVKLRNICTVISLPEIADVNTVIYRDFLKNTLGESVNTLFTETANRFKVSDLEAVNISESTHIGIDIKISDSDKFNTLLAYENVTAKLVLTNAEDVATVEFDSLKSGTKAGWHKIIARFDNAAIEEVTGFYLEFSHSNLSEKLGDLYSIELSIANVYAIDLSTTEANTLYGDKVTDFGVNYVEFTSGTFYKDFVIVNEGNFNAINDSEFIEFDLYIEDYDAFKNSFTKDTENNNVSVNLQFSLSNTTDLSGKTLTWSNIEEKIVYSGWNHIILPISQGTNNNFDNSQSVKGYKLEIVGDNKADKTPYNERIAIVDRLCATKYKTPNVSNQYDKFSELSLDGKQWNIGANFLGSATNEHHIQNAADFSECMFMEFDIYVQNYEAWDKTMQDGNSTGISMIISSTSGDDPFIDSRSTNFKDYITHSGWNHIVIPFGNFQKGSTSGTLDVSKISSYKIYYNGNTSASTGNLRGQYMSIANIMGTSIKVPDEYTGSMSVIAELDTPATSATYTDNFKLNLTNSSNEAVDFSKAAFIEFDIYIENYEDFIESFETDVNGKEVGISLCFGIGMTKTYADKNGYYQWNSIQKYITKSGWNHISLAIGAQDRSNGAPNGVLTLENIQSWKLWYGGDAYKTGEYVNRIGQDLVIIANINATGIVDPELPDNVLAQIGTSKTSTLGNYFHTAGDRYYEEKLSAVDFSRGTAIEFDIYIDDYEALLAAEEASANNYSGLERTRSSKLALYLSSTPAALWGQYSHPKNYYNGYITISDKITHSGWNHVRVGRADFVKANQGIDWTNINAWNLSFVNSSNVHPEVNPCPNVMVRICNIVSTGIVSNIPKDSNKKAKPDKSAVYISDAEIISDDYGSWNPSTVYISNDYKTEGKGSVSLDLNYKSTPEEANMFYLFDNTANMSDLKTLKFDFFIDLPQIIQVAGNKAEVVIANDKTAKDDLYKWEMDLSSLTTGWNALSLNIKKAVKIGKPKLNEAKIIMIRFTDINIDAQNFVEIVVGMDNLRYISSTGSRVLKLNESDSIGDISVDTDSEIDDGILEDDGLNNENTSDPQTKFIKTIKKIIYPDYLTAAIILGVEALVLTAAFIVFIIIYRKKKRARIAAKG